MILEPLLSELEESLAVHDRTVKIGFMLYELLTTCGYTDADIVDVSKTMRDIVS